MSESVHEKDMMLARIERLERENRRWKRAVLACLAGLASMAVMGVMGGLIGGVMAQTQTQTKSSASQKSKTKAAAPAPPQPAPLVLPKDIEAESFVLKDANGHVRASLSMAGAGPSFKLLDVNGSALVTLSLNDSAPGGPMLLLSGPEHGAGISMSVLAGAGSQLSLSGQRPDIQARIAVAPDGTTLELSDQDGFTTSIGSGVQPTKNGQTKKTTAAAITLMGKERKLLWSAP